MATLPGQFGGHHHESTMRDREPDTVTFDSDPLTLQLKDEDFIRVIDERIEQSQKYFDNELDWKTRRQRNKDYLFGDQIDEKQLKSFQPRYIDNIVYEAESTIKPIALGRLPDLLVKPGSESEESKKTADTMTDVINNDIRRRENRNVLGLAFKHHPVYFVGVIKPIWNPEKGEGGDYEFKVIHPDNIVVDHTATSNNPGNMDFIAEFTEKSIKEVIMRFPNKEKEIINAAGKDTNLSAKQQAGVQNNTEEGMASKIKLVEIWFTWWDKAKDEETGETKYERIEGVAWKYDEVLLRKMKNPYWDWTGERRLFSFTEGEKRDATEDEIRRTLFGEDTGLQQQRVFNNFFQDPKKPYIFLTYDRWGEHPFDSTSRIEQILNLQDNVNKRGRQITEMNDRARGKHVFSTESGLTKKDIENMDLENPDEDILIEGNLNEVHTFLDWPAAQPALFKEQEAERQKAFSKMGTHSTTRGERESSETATGRQILREADFGRIDDLVEETINFAAEKMAMWAMQFIKLFYTQDHMKRLIGNDGQIAFSTINRDSVEDGMEVEVTASGVDKQQRKKEAFEMARMKLTDPLTFFMDSGVSDPIGRTRKLMTFLTSPQLYMQQFVEGRGVEEMVGALNEQPVAGAESPPGGAGLSPAPAQGIPSPDQAPTAVGGGFVNGATGVQPVNFAEQIGFGGGGDKYGS